MITKDWRLLEWPGHPELLLNVRTFSYWIHSSSSLQQGPLGVSATPLRTPLRDTLSINPGDPLTPREDLSDQHLQSISDKRALKAGFMSLPRPENNFELLVPDDEPVEGPCHSATANYAKAVGIESIAGVIIFTIIYRRVSPYSYNLYENHSYNRLMCTIPSLCFV